jgi:hypothetical protein
MGVVLSTLNEHYRRQKDDDLYLNTWCWCSKNNLEDDQLCEICCISENEWNGTYFSNDGQVVTTEDVE